MDVADAIRARRSVRHFESRAELTDADLARLFELVVQSPSSFNLQHWRFVVVRDDAQRSELHGAAWEQAQVLDGSAVVVVCGKLDVLDDGPRAWAEAAPEARDTLVPMIRPFYEGKPQLMRDEAVRSASMAAMTLMLAATGMGLASGPMIGFDPARVAEIVGLDDDHVPVMLVVLGTAAGDPPPRPTRWPVSEVVRLETLDGPGLEA